MDYAGSDLNYKHPLLHSLLSTINGSLKLRLWASGFKIEGRMNGFRAGA